MNFRRLISKDLAIKVKKLHLQKGDTLIVQIPTYLIPKIIDQLKKTLTRVLKGREINVITVPDELYIDKLNETTMAKQGWMRIPGWNKEEANKCLRK